MRLSQAGATEPARSYAHAAVCGDRVRGRQQRSAAALSSSAQQQRTAAAAPADTDRSQRNMRYESEGKSLKRVRAPGAHEEHGDESDEQGDRRRGGEAFRSEPRSPAVQLTINCSV